MKPTEIAIDAQPRVETNTDEQLASWIQDRSETGDWLDVTNLSRTSIQTVGISSVLVLKILPCLINGIACGTALYKAAVWKLEWLKRQRDYIEQGGGGLSTDDKQRKLDELDKEKNEVLGKDKGKSWDVVKANLQIRIESLNDSYMRARRDGNYKVADEYNQQAAELQYLIGDMEKEGRPK